MIRSPGDRIFEPWTVPVPVEAAEGQQLLRVHVRVDARAVALVLAEVLHGPERRPVDHELLPARSVRRVLRVCIKLLEPMLHRTI